MHLDEPIADPACFPLFVLCEELKKQVLKICNMSNKNLMQYANQTGIVREMFSTKVWNKIMADIENYRK